MSKAKKLVLDLDAFSCNGYVYTKYDLGGEGHRIIINEKNKEKFLDAFAKEYREMAEEALEEYTEDDEND